MSQATPKKTVNRDSGTANAKGVGFGDGLGVSVKPFTSSTWRYECDLVGGPYDGDSFGRITVSKPKMGMRLVTNCEKYKLTGSKDGKAIFEHIGRRKYA